MLKCRVTEVTGEYRKLKRELSRDNSRIMKIVEVVPGRKSASFSSVIRMLSIGLHRVLAAHRTAIRKPEFELKPGTTGR